MWVEFVVGSCPCSEGSSLGSPVFLTLLRDPHFKFQLDLDRGLAGKPAGADVASILNIVPVLYMC